MSRFSVLAALLLLPLPHATPAQAESVEDVIALTDLAQELAFDIRQSRSQTLIRCNASEWCRLYGKEVGDAVNSADQNLRLGPLVAPLVEELFDHLEGPDLQDFFDFYRSPLGRRVVELERAGRAPERLQEVAENSEAIILRQSDERQALIESVDSVSDGSATRRMLDGSARQVVEWADARARENEEQPSPTKVEAPERSRYTFYLWLCLIYEPLSDEDLEAYVKFLESTAGETWSNVKRDIRRRVVEEAAKPIMVRLVRNLGDA